MADIMAGLGGEWTHATTDEGEVITHRLSGLTVRLLVDFRDLRRKASIVVAAISSAMHDGKTGAMDLTLQAHERDGQTVFRAVLEPYVWGVWA